jgi:hypothetical protein
MMRVILLRILSQSSILTLPQTKGNRELRIGFVASFGVSNELLNREIPADEI